MLKNKIDLKLEYFTGSIYDLSAIECASKNLKITLLSENHHFLDYLNNSYDFYQLFISDMFDMKSKKMVLRFKNNFSNCLEKTIQKIDVNPINKSFMICLVKQTIEWGDTNSRLLGIDKTRELSQDFICSVGEEVLKVGLSNSYSILEYSNLKDLSVDILLLRKYLSTEEIEVFEIGKNKLKVLFSD